MPDLVSRSSQPSTIGSIGSIGLPRLYGIPYLARLQYQTYQYLSCFCWKTCVFSHVEVPSDCRPPVVAFESGPAAWHLHFHSRFHSHWLQGWPASLGPPFESSQSGRPMHTRGNRYLASPVEDVLMGDRVEYLR